MTALGPDRSTFIIENDRTWLRVCSPKRTPPDHGKRRPPLEWVYTDRGSRFSLPDSVLTALIRGAPDEPKPVVKGGKFRLGRDKFSRALRKVFSAESFPAENTLRRESLCSPTGTPLTTGWLVRPSPASKRLGGAPFLPALLALPQPIRRANEFDDVGVASHAIQQRSG